MYISCLYSSFALLSLKVIFSISCNSFFSIILLFIISLYIVSFSIALWPLVFLVIYTFSLIDSSLSAVFLPNISSVFCLRMSSRWLNLSSVLFSISSKIILNCPSSIRLCIPFFFILSSSSLILMSKPFLPESLWICSQIFCSFNSK